MPNNCYQTCTPGPECDYHCHATHSYAAAECHVMQALRFKQCSDFDDP